jgi:hypothetical protein
MRDARLAATLILTTSLFASCGGCGEDDTGPGTGPDAGITGDETDAVVTDIDGDTGLDPIDADASGELPDTAPDADGDGDAMTEDETTDTGDGDVGDSKLLDGGDGVDACPAPEPNGPKAGEACSTPGAIVCSGDGQYTVQQPQIGELFCAHPSALVCKASGWSSVWEQHDLSEVPQKCGGRGGSSCLPAGGSVSGCPLTCVTGVSGQGFFICDVPGERRCEQQTELYVCAHPGETDLSVPPHTSWDDECFEICKPCTYWLLERECWGRPICGCPELQSWPPTEDLCVEHPDGQASCRKWDPVADCVPGDCPMP